VGRTEHPQAGSVYVTGRAIKFPACELFTVRPASALGEHSAQVLAEVLDLDPSQIGELRDKHVVA
jgi:crotonobetainyl-CoA:carnitine CoA-transferase CaiB-like acyl-CoA transferase